MAQRESLADCAPKAPPLQVWFGLLGDHDSALFGVGGVGEDEFAAHAAEESAAANEGDFVTGARDWSGVLVWARVTGVSNEKNRLKEGSFGHGR